jgi:hypothetical protein
LEVAKENSNSMWMFNKAVDFHSGSAFTPQIDKREVGGDVK